jgi:hypothetical protein
MLLHGHALKEAMRCKIITTINHESEQVHWQKNNPVFGARISEGLPVSMCGCVQSTYS